MPTNEVLVKQVPAVRVAELRAVAASYEPEAISPVVGPLFEQLCGRLEAAGLTPSGPGIAYYEPVEDGVLVHAAMPVANGHPGADADAAGLAIVDLPAAEAATLVHRGSMDRADVVTQELATWIESHGYEGSGYAREVYLEVPEDQAQWVTEFQEPIKRRR